MEIDLVVAVSDNGVIGRDGGLPWDMPADLAHFRRITGRDPMIMGRRTWESLPGPLPGREHLVLTRNPHYRAEGAKIFHTLDGALAQGAPRVTVIGGTELFGEALPIATAIHLTEIHAVVEGDTFFHFDRRGWVEVSRERHEADGDHPYPFSFVLLRPQAETLSARGKS